MQVPSPWRINAQCPLSPQILKTDSRLSPAGRQEPSGLAVTEVEVMPRANIRHRKRERYGILTFRLPHSLDSLYSVAFPKTQRSAGFPRRSKPCFSVCDLHGDVAPVREVRSEIQSPRCVQVTGQGLSAWGWGVASVARVGLNNLQIQGKGTPVHEVATDTDCGTALFRDTTLPPAQRSSPQSA